MSYEILRTKVRHVQSDRVRGQFLVIRGEIMNARRLTQIDMN